MNYNINLEKTGKRIKKLIDDAGIEVKHVQRYLGLTCPQSIYKWFKGKALPSVDNLYALSKLLRVHMEDLLVVEQTDEEAVSKDILFRIECYFKRIGVLVKLLNYPTNDK